MTARERDTYLEKSVEPLVREINGWKLEVGGHSGSWEYGRPGCDTVVCATPFWDGCDGIPVDVITMRDDGRGDDYRPVGVMNYAVTGDPQTDADAYRAAVGPFLPPA